MILFIYFCLIGSGEFDLLLLIILEILKKFHKFSENTDPFTNKSRSNSTKIYQRKIKQNDNLRKFWIIKKDQPFYSFSIDICRQNDDYRLFLVCLSYDSLVHHLT